MEYKDLFTEEERATITNRQNISVLEHTFTRNDVFDRKKETIITSEPTGVRKLVKYSHCILPYEKNSKEGWDEMPPILTIKKLKEYLFPN